MAKKKCSCKKTPRKKEIKKHLRGDIKGYKQEIKEDKKLIGKLKNGKT